MAREFLLSQEFGNNIFTRKTVSAFFEEVNSQDEAEIILNFKSVKFISRSCADEYLKQKEKSIKKVVERNLSPEVRSMFNAVQNQYKKKGFSITFVDDSNSSKRELVA